MCELQVYRRVLQNQIKITEAMEASLAGAPVASSHLAGHIAGLNTALCLLDAFLTDETRRRLESQTACSQRTIEELRVAGQELSELFRPKMGESK